MFSFHKPKVYRSTTGCCICKAKSSSSRFTDSKKYEGDFIKCFHLATPRQGEICNACVLLVKRWKKLPPGSTRNWQHVVDARAGPGMKSMTKFKSKYKKQLLEGAAAEAAGRSAVSGVCRKKKHFEREYSPLSDKSDGAHEVEMDMAIDYLSEMAASGGSSRADSTGGSDCDDSVQISKSSRRHKSQAKRRADGQPMVSEFIDMNVWKKVKICCGTIFENPNGEILVDHRFLKPCGARLSCKMSGVLPKGDADMSAAKSYSDSSSDSGYDESSNQSNGEHALPNFSTGVVTTTSKQITSPFQMQKQVSTIALAGQVADAN